MRANPSPSFYGSDLLDAVPLKNECAIERRSSAGELVVSVPLQERWFMRPPISWILQFSRERSVALDKIGEEVWSQCDGEKSIEEIVERFTQRHGTSFHESRLAVMQFVQDLVRRDLLVVVVEDEEAP